MYCIYIFEAHCIDLLALGWLSTMRDDGRNKQCMKMG